MSFDTDKEAAAFNRSQLQEAMAMARIGSIPRPYRTRLQGAPETGPEPGRAPGTFQQSATFDTANKILEARVSSVQDAGVLQEELAETYESILKTYDQIFTGGPGHPGRGAGYLRETSRTLPWSSL